MARRRYTNEYKKEAARMIIIDGTPVKEVSEQLGVNPGMLYNWKSQFLEELQCQSPAGSPSPKAMALELASLRKELAKSRMINEILKKTVGYFSKDAI